MMQITRQLILSGACTTVLLTAVPAYAFSTMAQVNVNSCGGIDNSLDGAVGQVSAAGSVETSGVCDDASASSATASATANVALAGVSVFGNGTGFQEFNGAFAQASFGERLTIENVPAGIDSIDLRVVIAWIGTPPAPAFYNSASMDAYVNPQGITGRVQLQGCSGDLCAGGLLPVRSETLEEVVTLPRNGLGTFGNIDVYMDARFNIASTQSAMDGSMTVQVLGVPEATIVSESGVFGSGGQVDSDGDGVPDNIDNCTDLANPTQLDADGDGFGNACDADLNNDCVVNTIDLGLLRTVFFSADPVADFNGDGVVNVADLGIMRLAFFAAPGPSDVALICAG